MARLLADTAPLKDLDFRRLWLANIVTVIGAQLTIVAVPAQIYLITGSSAYVGLTGVFGLVPLVVFGLWGGALADAMDRRMLLVCTTVGLIGCSALFWLQAAAGVENVWVILALFSVQQAFFAVNQPTRTAILPRLLPARELPAALSLSMTVTQAGAIAGPLVGGAMIPALGFPLLYLLDTIFLLPTLFAVIRLPSMKPDGDAPRAAGLRSVIDGLRYLSREKILLASFVVDLIAMILGMPRALFPQMAHENFGGPAEGGWAFALLFVAISAGAVLGGVFSGWVSHVRRQGLAVIVCILIWGVAVAGAGVAVAFSGGSALPILPVVLVLLMIGGAADMASSAFRQSIMLAAANDEVRGRLQGVFLVVVAGGPRIADVAHGAAAASVGVAWATSMGGVGVVLATLVAAVLIPSFIRYRVGGRE
ncbi:MFS transporter [Gordonia sp. (in: high G+C Gram-positive bacteria)]|uniref:MFS transporter n=1 Tax=Gordonia sp. (in: high G+C Gram-positive bacteria) TaxID=84139 RepID=UPI001E094BCF|nr:MFS transporter [Gordonia sp. (in: high G+C Gram-positive bacteria)]MCB1294796.1 MFS transporter [Gordonia sp. (in: high G+C Gram-positive bacteria)]HMS77266.1 MFS transporter [Gordonia sp. (in: high G+C Gram-positive bacteria)]